jgi:riboflavin transporter FmnP
MDAKQTAFIAIMSALGFALSLISLNVAPFMGTAAGGAALDLSHIATFIAAFFGGPLIGAAVGFLSGIYAGYYFGYVLGTIGVISVIGVPTGKALTGLFAGFLYKRTGLSNGSTRTFWVFPLTLLSYVPEAVYTVLYFLYLVPLINGQSMAFMVLIVLPKAWLEITLMSVLMSALAGNVGFKQFVTRFFYLQKQKRPQRNEVVV